MRISASNGLFVPAPPALCPAAKARDGILGGAFHGAQTVEPGQATMGKTGSMSENALLNRFCRAVDAALRPILAGHERPLVVAASEPLASIYRVFMSVAGLVAGTLANSSVILPDGLFSLIGVAAALPGRRVSLRVGDGPDKLRPPGYAAADEAIFSTFRALSLLGVVLFAAFLA